ncbi:MAG: tRNA pseudouridine(13) synthase TruD [Methanophagales archaeon ANME-1-THS]|nr:MAG: tRNA pseudouridine(13) synthase TruD [Methanophagales archaeon ANME-1-THS]
MELKESPEYEKQIGIWFYATKTDGIGGVIKTIPADFVVREITEPLQGRGAEPHTRERGQSPRVRGQRGEAPLEGRYLIAELTKENWDTHSAVREIARRLGVSRNRIGFAGTKDKFALTTQRISIWDTDEDALERVKIADISLTVIGRSNKAVSLGDLHGNEFKIVIRNLEGEKEELTEKIELITNELEELGGIPNFFGVQRFGISRPITHIVGKYLIQGEIKAAVMSYLADIFPGESEEAKHARRLCKEGDLKACLKQMPLALRYERAMLNELVKRGCEREADLLAAFSALPKTLQKLFVHAYQAYLFNLVVSQRMARKIPLNRAIEGDVVCFLTEFGIADPDKVERVTEEKVEAMNRLIKRGRAFVTAPIFGYEAAYADGMQGEIERSVLCDEAIELADFYSEKMPELSSKGTRRPVVVPVQMKLCEDEITDDELNPGRLKVTLQFFLPKGSYATVLLREYMKTPKQGETFLGELR